MKYTESQKIENVKSSCPSNGDYAYTRKQKGYLYTDGVLLEKGDAPLELSLRGKYMYVWYSHLGSFELYEGHTLLNSIERNVTLLNEQTQYIGKTYEESNPFRQGYNFASSIDGQLILPRFTPYTLYVEDDIVVTYDNFSGEFKRVNTQIRALWQFPLSLLGGTEYEFDRTDKIDKILEVIHGNTQFYTDFYRLAALDLETGNKVYSFDCFGVCLDKRISSIFAISSNVITIVDTKKLAIIERHDFLETDPTGIRTYRRVFSPMLQGGYFTPLGKKEEDLDSNMRRISILDYRTRKLVWEYEFISIDEYGQTRNHSVPSKPLYMIGNKLYIKDFKNTLHTFEQEGI